MERCLRRVQPQTRSAIRRWLEAGGLHSHAPGHAAACNASAIGAIGTMCSGTDSPVLAAQALQ
eukprot:6129702-Alexandrium_andersonii.AAC.1